MKVYSWSVKINKKTDSDLAFSSKCKMTIFEIQTSLDIWTPLPPPRGPQYSGCPAFGTCCEIIWLCYLMCPKKDSQIAWQQTAIPIVDSTLSHPQSLPSSCEHGHRTLINFLILVPNGLFTCKGEFKINLVHIDRYTKFDLVNWTLSAHAHMILFSLIIYWIL